MKMLHVIACVVCCTFFPASAAWGAAASLPAIEPVGTVDHSIALAPIPEPSVAVAIAGGMAVLLGWRRLRG